MLGTSGHACGKFFSTGCNLLDGTPQKKTARPPVAGASKFQDTECDGRNVGSTHARGQNL
jgi:hypothetical protein